MIVIGRLVRDREVDLVALVDHNVERRHDVRDDQLRPMLDGKIDRESDGLHRPARAVGRDEDRLQSVTGRARERVVHGSPPREPGRDLLE